MTECSQLPARDGISDLVRRILADRSIERSVSGDDDLRAIGLTSLDMISLVLSVESMFDVRIPEAEITPANFRTVSTIDALVATLRG